MSSPYPCCQKQPHRIHKTPSMTGIKTILFFYLFLPTALTLHAGPSDPLGPQFALIPQPQRIEGIDGQGLLFTELQTVLVEDLDQARLLSGALAKLPLGEKNTPGSLSLHIDAAMDLPSPEGYILKLAD